MSWLLCFKKHKVSGWHCTHWCKHNPNPNMTVDVRMIRSHSTWLASLLQMIEDALTFCGPVWVGVHNTLKIFKSIELTSHNRMFEAVVKRGGLLLFFNAHSENNKLMSVYGKSEITYIMQPNSNSNVKWKLWKLPLVCVWPIMLTCNISYGYARQKT